MGPREIAHGDGTAAHGQPRGWRTRIDAPGGPMSAAHRNDQDLDTAVWLPAMNLCSSQSLVALWAARHLETTEFAGTMQMRPVVGGE